MTKKPTPRSAPKKAPTKPRTTAAKKAAPKPKKQVASRPSEATVDIPAATIFPSPLALPPRSVVEAKWNAATQDYQAVGPAPQQEKPSSLLKPALYALGAVLLAAAVWWGVQ